MIETVLLNGLWQGAIIVAVAAVAARFVARSASTRYAVWLCGLLAIALTPIASSINLGAPVPYTPIAAPIHAAASFTAHASNWQWLIVVWAIGVALCVARLIFSSLRIAGVLHRSVPATHLGHDIVTSSDVSIPISAGFFSPVVIVPTELASTMSAAELAPIIEHERAHIRRGDILTNLAQRLVEAALFFNPFVYLIGAQLIREREIACDDAAVRIAVTPVAYASSLMRLAQSTTRPQTALLSPSVIGSGHVLVGRIARVLNGKSRTFGFNAALVVAVIAVFGGLMFFLESTMAHANPVIAKATACTVPNADASVITPGPIVYPDGAAAKGPRAAVVEVMISATGAPTGTHVYKTSGDPLIDKAAANAAMASTYSPKTVGCKGVAGAFLFRADFTPQS